MGFVADKEEQNRFVPDSAERPVTALRSGTLGPAEAALQMATGGIAAPVAGIAGLIGAALPGPEGQGARWAKGVQQFGTYQPRTTEGKLASELAGKPFELLADVAGAAGRKTQDMTGSPLAATAVQSLIETAPAIAMGVRSIARGRQPAHVAADEALNATRDATINNAVDAGYKFPSAAVQPSSAGHAIESVAGNRLLTERLIRANQRTTNRLAAEEVGLSADRPITIKALNDRAEVLAEPYRQAARIDPAIAADVQALRETRSLAKKWWRFAESREGHPIAEAKARKLDARAEQIEGFIEDATRNAGRPELMPQIREARQKIAQVHAVERALVTSTGDVSAASFARLLDKNRPLSGNLKLIAQTAEAMPQYTSDVVGIKNPGQAGGHPLIGAGISGGGVPHLTIGAYGGSGGGGVPLLRGPMQSLVMSEPYQDSLVRPRYPVAPNMQDLSLAAILAGGRQPE